MIRVYGREFAPVAYPRCRFRSHRQFGHPMKMDSVTVATYISPSIVICRAPLRSALPSKRLQVTNFVDPDHETTSPWWEQVDVNTKLVDSFALRLNGINNYANAPYH